MLRFAIFAFFLSHHILSIHCLHKMQAVHNTPLNHIGLWVDNLPLAVQWLTSQARSCLILFLFPS